MNASEILRQVKEAYAGFSSYADRGTTTLNMNFGEMLRDLGMSQQDFEKMQREAPKMQAPLVECPQEFATFFARPNNFRFEWRDWHPFFGKSKPPNENALCSNDKATYSKFLGSLERTRLDMAVAGATGISAGSVLMISKLLMPNYIDSAFDWFDMIDVRLQSEVEIDGSRCFHLVGTVLNKDDHEAWITADNFFVRRISSRMKISKEEADGLQQEAQSVLEQAGMDESGVPPLGALDYHTVYDYTEVAINKTIELSLFDAI